MVAVDARLSAVAAIWGPFGFRHGDPRLIGTGTRGRHSDRLSHPTAECEASKHGGATSLLVGILTPKRSRRVLHWISLGKTLALYYSNNSI